MSLTDKILELYEEYGALSTERVTFLLQNKFGISRNVRTIQREIKKLVEERKIVALPLKGRQQTYELFSNVSLSLSGTFLSRIWDEIFEIRAELHYPENQLDRDWESYFRLRSLIQLLPANFKERVSPKMDNFTLARAEEVDKIKREIGPTPILTLGGVPFGEYEISRKKRKQEIVGTILEKRVEEIIGEIASYLHEVVNNRGKE